MKIALDDWTRQALRHIVNGHPWEALKAANWNLGDVHLQQAVETLMAMLERADPEFLEEQRRWEYARQICELPHRLPNNRKHWSMKEIELMCNMWMIGMTPEEIGNLFRQNPNAIRMRLQECKLIDAEGNELIERRDLQSNGEKWDWDPSEQAMRPIDRRIRLE